MEFKSNVAAYSVSLKSEVPFRDLALVNSRKPEAAYKKARSAGSLFSAAETRHNFAIWPLEKSGTSRRRSHLYYCVRCKWAFRVDDSGSVTSLDQNGNPVREREAAERLATFGVGPCPVFSRLTGSARLTQAVTRREVLRGRFAALLGVMDRIWKAPNRGWRRPVRSARGRTKMEVHSDEGGETCC